MSFELDLRAVLDRYMAAYAARDAAACPACYADDAEIHSPFGPPARGRPAILGTHLDWFATDEKNKRLEMLEADARDGLAFALLRYSADVPDGPEAGTSLNVVEAATSGQWHFRLTSLNADFETIDSETDTE